MPHILVLLISGQSRRQTLAHCGKYSAAIVEVAGWGHAFVGQEAELFQEVTILQRSGQRSIPFPAESRAWHNIRSALLLLWHHKSCLSYSFKCSC